MSLDYYRGVLGADRECRYSGPEGYRVELGGIRDS